MNKLSLLTMAILIGVDSFSQATSSTVNFADATLAVGNYQGSLAISYIHDWRLGAKRKLAIGLGGRLTSYFGQNQYFTTAPAKLTSGRSGPAIIFDNTIDANIDSLLVKSPQVNTINLFINFDYAFSQKLMVGLNIDAIGFSFGGKRQANYINGASGKITEGSPTAFNLLLVSDNDLGSLNSELYFKYFFSEKWGVKAGAQFLFTEYTTTTKVQTYPEENDRFRNKSLMFSLGVSYKLK